MNSSSIIDIISLFAVSFPLVVAWVNINLKLICILSALKVEIITYFEVGIFINIFNDARLLEYLLPDKGGNRYIKYYKYRKKNLSLSLSLQLP